MHIITLIFESVNGADVSIGFVHSGVDLNGSVQAETPCYCFAYNVISVATI